MRQSANLDAPETQSVAVTYQVVVSWARGVLNSFSNRAVATIMATIENSHVIKRNHKHAIGADVLTRVEFCWYSRTVRGVYTVGIPTDTVHVRYMYTFLAREGLLCTVDSLIITLKARAGVCQQ